MNVNFNNVGFYNKGIIKPNKTQSFKSLQQFLSDTKMPNNQEYQQKVDMSSWDKKEDLREEYTDKILSVCFDENGKLNPQIKEFLDNTELEIKNTNGAVEKSTIIDYLKKCASEKYQYKGRLFHATSDSNVQKNIIENGFDSKKISRTNLGPGFYFGDTEGSVNCYSSAIVVADCEGKCSNFDKNFYDGVKNTQCTNKLAEFLGSEPCATYPVGMWQHVALTKVIDEYTRNALINDLGIDMAYGIGDRDYCYAVFNPDSISNIRPKEDYYT